MNFIKRMTSTEKGRKSTVITAVLVLVGIMLTIVGTPSFTSGEQIEGNIKELCEKVCIQKQVYVEVNTDKSGEVMAIAVVCKNGDDPQIRLKITEMLSTLYCIPSTRIYVTNFG